MNSTNVKRQVINELNEKYGADLLNYEKCKQIYEQLKKEKAHIENEVIWLLCVQIKLLT